MGVSWVMSWPLRRSTVGTIPFPISGTSFISNMEAMVSAVEEEAKNTPLEKERVDTLYGGI